MFGVLIAKKFIIIILNLSIDVLRDKKMKDYSSFILIKYAFNFGFLSKISSNSRSSIFSWYPNNSLGDILRTSHNLSIFS